MVDERGTHPGARAFAGGCAGESGESAADFRHPRQVVFSIALPVVGQTRFLPDALTSIAVQTVPLQVAVMDATPDDSVQRVIDRHRERIHYSRHGPDAGQSAAIREGWCETTGDVVGWLCADDCLFPGALAQVAEVFLQHPDVDVVYGDGIFIDHDGRFIRYFPAISEDVGRLPWVNCITQPSCFVRRAAMERVGGVRTDLHYTMDWDLWVRLLLAGCRFH
jgi:glycosyltransferase involved in cell wall biosynthesis